MVGIETDKYSENMYCGKCLCHNLLKYLHSHRKCRQTTLCDIEYSKDKSYITRPTSIYALDISLVPKGRHSSLKLKPGCVSPDKLVNWHSTDSSLEDSTVFDNN